MGKHTEGPWVEYMGHQVSGSLGDCVMFATDRGELIFSTDANRDLVLAAPDLLEALEEIISNAEPECGEPDCRDCFPWRKARAAIRHAKGESE